VKAVAIPKIDPLKFSFHTCKVRNNFTIFE
jgi:hypothetical protein